MRVEDMNLPTPASASNYSDALSERGIFVGAQVDVRSVQHEMLDQLKFQREKWEKQIRILDEISSSLRKRDFMKSERTGAKVAM